MTGRTETAPVGERHGARRDGPRADDGHLGGVDDGVAAQGARSAEIGERERPAPRVVGRKRALPRTGGQVVEPGREFHQVHGIRRLQYRNHEAARCVHGDPQIQEAFDGEGVVCEVAFKRSFSAFLSAWTSAMMKKGV